MRRKKQLLTWAVTQDDTFLNSSKSTPIFWVGRKLMIDEKEKLQFQEFKLQFLEFKLQFLEFKTSTSRKKRALSNSAPLDKA